MKFLPIALLAVGVSAQTTTEPTSIAAPAASSSCEADYIVERCLSTEKDKVEACDATDYDCQCAAYEAVATCYNNCPNDPRATSANQQVLIFCQQASIHGTKSSNISTTPTGTMATAPATTSDDDEDDEDEPRGSNTATFDAEVPTESDAAGILFINAGGALAAVAGAIAALL
ncbi:hypothetical protein LIA77_09280 [Sarocladium implicatum]|nr:hypothetical protein LIA77_09280 [Sarocladium implicatum]